MAKEKTAYVCSACGYDSPKWYGKCPSCGAWDSFEEIKVGKEPSKKTYQSTKEECKQKPTKIREIEAAEEPRIDVHLRRNSDLQFFTSVDHGRTA